ncbi:MAG: toxin-antitoxin system YwqK family antitoxin [Bacteroidia bacterium]|nr:toxin-antitoxin system YwqK family antitoxin [Bacteroidia bacterium]
MKYFIFSILFLYSLANWAQQPVDAKNLVEKKEVFYYNGAPYSGPCFENYPSGAKGVEGAYEKGKKDGAWIWYYENGAKKRETNYNSGKMNGLSIIWYKNGQKRSEIVYEMGQNVKQLRWDEEGNFLPPPVFGPQ